MQTGQCAFDLESHFRVVHLEQFPVVLKFDVEEALLK